MATAGEKALQQVMSELVNFTNNIKSPKLNLPDYSSVYDTLKPIQLPKVDWSGFEKGYDGAEKKKKKKEKVDLTPNLWDVLTGTFGQLGGMVTNAAYNVVKDANDIYKNVKKGKLPSWKTLWNLAEHTNPIGMLREGVAGGLKHQLKDWKDGTLTWGDIPGIGFLHGMDKSWKRGEDIMKELGVQNRWGRVGGGLAIDIALDPLTYFTGGASLAAKLGKVAELNKINELSKSLGIVGKFKNADEFVDAARSTLRAKYPNMSADIIEKRIGQIADEIKTARNTVYNANINKFGLSVPFSKRLTVAVDDIPKWSPLYRTEAALGDKYRHLAENLINDAAINPQHARQIEQQVKKLYGVNDLSELTKTQYSDLFKRLSPVIEKAGKGLPDAKVISKLAEKDMPQHVFDALVKHGSDYKAPWKDVQNQIDEILSQVGHDAKLRSSIGADLAELTSKYWQNQPINNNFNKIVNQRKAERMAEISKLLRDSDKLKYVETKLDELYKYGHPASQAYRKNRYVMKALEKPFNEMANAKTKFEHLLDRHNPFDARTLKTDDPFLNSMANHIADAQSRKIGEFVMYEKHLADIENFIKKNNVTDEEMKQAIYHIEGHIPDRLLKNGNYTPSRKVVQLANLIRPLLATLGSDEVAAGVLSKLRANYFPHVLNRTDVDMEEIRKFLERHPELQGLSKGNKFNKERKTFQTLAQLENHIDMLKEAIANETDPENLANLQRQLERVQNLFDTNIITALSRRVKEGVRARAMKAMQDELKKYGMLVSNPKDISQLKNPGMKKLDAEEAKKLGLGEGQHYINEKVFDGLKRVDEIFTNEGMNKLVRHMTAFSDIWRSLVTYYKPSHYRNNIIGNVIVNMAAGVRANDYKTAFKLIKAYRSGNITDEQLKLMKAAYRHNVVSGGFLFDSRPTFTFDEPTKLEKVAEKVRDFKPVKRMRQKGEIIDDVSRLANFLNGIRKYGSAEKAAQQVREYLFNYNELTNADRAMRVIVPFWNWMKRNVPLQMKLLMENPKFPMNVERFKQLFNEDEPGADWQKDYGIKVPGMNYYTSLPSPTSDLEMLLNPRQALGSLNPVIKIPIELATNKKLYTGSPISYGSDTVKPEDLPAYFAQNFGIAGNAYDALSGKQTILESLTNLINPITRINKVGQGRK